MNGPGPLLPGLLLPHWPRLINHRANRGGRGRGYREMPIAIIGSGNLPRRLSPRLACDTAPFTGRLWKRRRAHTGPRGSGRAGSEHAEPFATGCGRVTVGEILTPNVLSARLVEHIPSAPFFRVEVFRPKCSRPRPFIISLRLVSSRAEHSRLTCLDPHYALNLCCEPQSPAISARARVSALDVVSLRLRASTLRLGRSHGRLRLSRRGFMHNAG